MNQKKRMNHNNTSNNESNNDEIVFYPSYRLLNDIWILITHEIELVKL